MKGKHTRKYHKIPKSDIIKKEKAIKKVKEKKEKAIIEDIEEKVGKLSRSEILLKARGSRIAKLEEKYKMREMFQEADIVNTIKEVDGYISLVAEKLKVPAKDIKEFISKSKKLQDMIIDIKEAQIENVEKSLYDAILAKQNPLLMMFYLKCQGQQRGWIDKPMKDGSSIDKPIYIKIMPVMPLTDDGKKKAGRPKKDYAEIKILPGIPTTIVEDEAIDVEYTD